MPNRRTHLGPIAADATVSADGERGATMALVAISLAWMIGLAALVLDVGGGLLTRQNLVVASDAAALAAAQDLVNAPWDEWGACATAGLYVLDNAPDAVMVNCDAQTLGADGGWVTVTVTEDLETNFAEVDEGSTSQVSGVSSAAWGPPATVTALRPIGLCYDGSAALRQLIDNPPFGPTWVRVDFIRDDPTACGGTADGHNFATVDFETGSSDQDIRNWMRDGYPGQVGFDPLAVADCSLGAVCYDRPYASGAIGPELELLKASGEYVLFPVYNYADTDLVHPVGMLRARLYQYQFSGEPETWYMELKIDPGLVAGTCCGPGDLRSGSKVIAICGVDPAVSGTCEATAG